MFRVLVWILAAWITLIVLWFAVVTFLGWWTGKPGFYFP
jgi:hypothetical protein